MKKLLVILTIALLSISCSSDDNSDDNSSSTFLENYAGTKWESQNDDELYDYYLRFINNLNTPLESWGIDAGDDCYEYELGNLIDLEYEITENLENIFQLTYISPEETGGFRINITVIDNTLEMEFVNIENGNETSMFIDYYLSTSIDVDNFTLCE